MEDTHTAYRVWAFTLQTFPMMSGGFLPRPKLAGGQSGWQVKRFLQWQGETGTFEDGLRILKEEKSKGKPFLYICFLNEAGIERHKTVNSTGHHPDRKKSFINRLTDTTGSY